MTTGRINQVAPSMTPRAHEPPRASGGSTRARPSFVSSEERSIGHLASTTWKHARTVFCIPKHSQRPQPKPRARGDATRVDDSPRPKGPPDTPRGASSGR